MGQAHLHRRLSSALMREGVLQLRGSNKDLPKVTKLGRGQLAALGFKPRNDAGQRRRRRGESTANWLGAVKSAFLSLLAASLAKSLRWSEGE